MSDIKKGGPIAPDVKLKTLSKDILRKQITEADNAISYQRQQILQLEQAIQQNTGIINFSRHLLSQFELPEKIEEPKKKTDLEVK